MGAHDLVLVAHAFSTLAMTGLIWFVQIVHYPMFDRVGVDVFAEYEMVHARRTGFVVAPLMLTEAVTSAAIAISPPPGIDPGWAWAGLVMVGALWASTAFLQVPCHRALERGFDARVHRRLVATNWVRTALWTARGFLALGMLGWAA